MSNTEEQDMLEMIDSISVPNNTDNNVTSNTDNTSVRSIENSPSEKEDSEKPIVKEVAPPLEDEVPYDARGLLYDERAVIAREMNLSQPTNKVETNFKVKSKEEVVSEEVVKSQSSSLTSEDDKKVEIKPDNEKPVLQIKNTYVVSDPKPEITNKTEESTNKQKQTVKVERTTPPVTEGKVDVEGKKVSEEPKEKQVSSGKEETVRSLKLDIKYILIRKGDKNNVLTDYRLDGSSSWGSNLRTPLLMNKNEGLQMLFKFRSLAENDNKYELIKIETNYTLVSVKVG